MQFAAAQSRRAPFRAVGSGPLLPICSHRPNCRYRWQDHRPPHPETHIAHRRARARLGVEPLRLLFAWVADPVAQSGMPGASGAGSGLPRSTARPSMLCVPKTHPSLWPSPSSSSLIELRASRLNAFRNRGSKLEHALLRTPSLRDHLALSRSQAWLSNGTPHPPNGPSIGIHRVAKFVDAEMKKWSGRSLALNGVITPASTPFSTCISRCENLPSRNHPTIEVITRAP